MSNNGLNGTPQAKEMLKLLREIAADQKQMTARMEEVAAEQKQAIEQIGLSTEVKQAIAQAAAEQKQPIEQVAAEQKQMGAELKQMFLIRNEKIDNLVLKLSEQREEREIKIASEAKKSEGQVESKIDEVEQRGAEACDQNITSGKSAEVRVINVCSSTKRVNSNMTETLNISDNTNTLQTNQMKRTNIQYDKCYELIISRQTKRGQTWRIGVVKRGRPKNKHPRRDQGKHRPKCSLSKADRPRMKRNKRARSTMKKHSNNVRLDRRKVGRYRKYHGGKLMHCSEVHSLKSGGGKGRHKSRRGYNLKDKISMDRKHGRYKDMLQMISRLSVGVDNLQLWVINIIHGCSQM